MQQNQYRNKTKFNHNDELRLRESNLSRLAESAKLTIDLDLDTPKYQVIVVCTAELHQARDFELAA